jgi:VIT1/CCC1 family predicted Fe2+/Mn2+ transporter
LPAERFETRLSLVRHIAVTIICLRAVATEPAVLPMDDPCSALDPAASRRIEELMAESKKKQYTIAMDLELIRQPEAHRSGRAGWLRAAVLGADDGIVSTASLMIGVAAASASKQAILVAGVAGLVAGSMSMAAGEYVSVSAQRDLEQADIELERRHLAEDPRAELNELAMIYVERGLEKELAMKVAHQLSDHDRLASHLRDELGIEARSRARPLQAAWISATSFAFFAAIPIAALLIASPYRRIPAIAVSSLASLAALGAFGGQLGGAPPGRAALRVIIGGGLAMAVTAVIGRLLGVSIG